MRFRTETVDIDGEGYTLRELSGLAFELVQRQPSEVRQGFALIALSLLDAQGAPRYGEATLDEGIAAVGAWPARVSNRLAGAVQRLNQDEGDAPGNG